MSVSLCRARAIGIPTCTVLKYMYMYMYAKVVRRSGRGNDQGRSKCSGAALRRARERARLSSNSKKSSARRNSYMLECVRPYTAVRLYSNMYQRLIRCSASVYSIYRILSIYSSLNRIAELTTLILYYGRPPVNCIASAEGSAEDQRMCSNSAEVNDTRLR